MRLYNYCSEALKNSVLEAFGSKRYFTKLLHVCNRLRDRVCSSDYVESKIKVDNHSETILMRAITKSISGKWFYRYFKGQIAI